MTDVKPSDFHNDELYTRIEAIKAKSEEYICTVDIIKEDFLSVEKYLKSFSLPKSYCLYNGEFSLLWDNDEKKIMSYTETGKLSIHGCSSQRRIAAYEELPSLLDGIINSY